MSQKSKFVSFSMLAVVAAAVTQAQIAGAFAQTPPAPPAAEQAAPPSPEEGRPEKKAEKKEKVRPGLIASSGQVSVGSDGVVPADTGDAAPGGEPNAISGSVSNSGRGKCTATVKNTSEKNSYRARFALVGVNKRGNRVLNRAMSATLRPGESETRQVSCGEDLNIGLELKSATPLDN